MRKEELLMRLVANEKAIPVGVLTKRSFDEKDLTHIKLAIERLEKLNLFVYDKGDCSIDKIKAYAREHKRKYGELSLIVVDYLQILNIKETGKGTRSQAVGSVTRQAKQLAMELNCCFMMLSQLSRPKDKQDEVPQLHHLRDSGEIEQDADVVEFLHNDIGKRNTDGEFVVSTIAKGRATGTGEFYLRFAKWYQRFKEIPKNTSEG
jgi:replicative DNA helicase